MLIVIDTLRGDRLGYAGYASAVTPNLDELAARGTSFTDASTPVPVTLPAVSSLLTGRQPFHHGVRDNEHYALPAGETTLAERFAAAGWRTGAVVASAILASDRGLDQGFGTYDDDFTGPYPVYRPDLESFADELAATRRRADVVTDRALARVAAFGDEPFFLLVHYFDPHSFYDPPPAAAARQPAGPYDAEITFVDEQIGRLLDGLPGGATVVVVSDHGESLGEHGEPEHGFLLYQATLHVPVVAAGPGIPAGRRGDPVSLVDLEPTLAAWFDLAPARDRDGRTLSWDRPETRTVPIYAETMRPLVSYHWSELRAVRLGDGKLIHGPPGEFYDLARDPGETANLIETADIEPPAAALRDLTGGETRADVLAALAAEVEPGRRELLESLGYVGGADEPPAAEGEFPHPREELPRWLARQGLKTLYREGGALAAAGRHAEALAAFDSVLAAGYVRADVHYNRALVRRELGDAAGSSADIAEALRLNPDYVPALAVQAREAGPDRARSLWLRILELDPEHTAALREMARHHLERGEPAQALPYLRRQANQAPRDPGIRFNLGLAAREAGRAEEARENFLRFLDLAPDHPNAAAVRRLLEEPGGG